MSEDNLHEAQDAELRAQLEQKEFVLREAYWREARRMIDHDRPSKRRMYILPLVMLSALFGAGITWLLVQTLPASTDQQTAPASHTLADLHTQVTAHTPDLSDPTTTIPSHIPAAQEQVVQTSHPGSSMIEPGRTQATGSKSTTGKSQPKVTVTGRRQPAGNNTRPSVVIPVIQTPDMAELQEKPTTSVSNSVYTSRLFNSRGPSPLLWPVLSYCDTCLHPVKDYINSHEAGDGSTARKFFMLEAGATCFNPGTLPEMLQPTAGIRYYHFVTPSLFWNAGLFYSRIHTTPVERQFTSARYSFGRNTKTTSVQANRMDYLELPVNLGAEWTKGHYLSAGVSVSYLLYTGNTLIETSYEGVVKKTSEDGHVYMVNPLDVQLTAGYSMMLTHHFQVALAGSFGLTDYFDDEKDNNPFNRNRGLRLHIGYKIY
jgi:hypothetical protein